MKTILALAAVAVVASLIGAISLLNSSFAAQDTSNQPAVDPSSAQNTAVQDNNGSDNDKETNDVADQEKDDDDNNSGSDEADIIDPQLASQAKVTPDQARDTAMKHVSAQPSDVKSVELDDENGQLVYSVEIAKAGQSSDVKVDAISGQVAYVEQAEDDEFADDGEIDDNDAETNDDNVNSASDDHSDGEQADDGVPQ